jgi:leucyl/phenylalanyl-tRNA--protein transferase
MPVFRLPEVELLFPPVELAEEGGILAVGGDLSPSRLLLAYASGIFPWYSREDPIMWWSPDPRCVLYPGTVHISKSMRKLFRKKRFTVTLDREFEEVIRSCGAIPRRHEDGTWITGEMIDAYIELHQRGYAHSLEVWDGDELAGGLYGVALGHNFSGESMFSRVPNASKYGFITLSMLLEERSYVMLDCQVPNPHLLSMGAVEIPRHQYINDLAQAVTDPVSPGSWGEWDVSSLLDKIFL